MLSSLLTELEAQWHRLGAPVARALRPGLSERGLDSLAAALDVDLPRELRELWAWHDGAEPGVRGSIGPGGYEFLTTEEVVAQHRMNLEVHAESPDPEAAPDLFWHRSWVAFMVRGAQRLYVDTARRPTSGVSPVRLVSWEWEDVDVDRAPSLAAAVSMWTWLLQSGAYRWDADGREHDDWNAVPLFARWSLA